MTFLAFDLRHLTKTLMLAIASACCHVCLLAQNADPDVLEFALITDTHQYGSTADIRVADQNVNSFIDYCNSTPQIEFAMFGGDFYNAYDTDHEQGMLLLSQAAQGFSRLRMPFYATRGNHDCNGKCRTPDGKRDNTQIITDREFHTLFNPTNRESVFYHPEGIVTDPDNPYGNYYYRDFEQQRVRIVVLNNYDRDSLEIAGYHGQQMRWLAETALDFRQKEDPASWNVLLLGHALIIDQTNNPISRLLHAYVRGQDFFDTDAGVTYGCRYSNRQNARFIGFIYGHYHEDIYTNWDGYNMIAVNRGYATGSETGRYEESFDHFVINTRTHIIEERRIGRGQSRTYSYDPPQQLLPGLAFAEAEGMGRHAVGGGRGHIVHVTNLDDDGEGSLRWAIDQEGARTVVFDVEGTIQLQSPLIIRHDSLTLAGQSAPGLGITLADAPLIVNASEVIVRYLNVLQLRDQDFGHRGLIVDHVTARCDTASAIDIRRTASVSVQYCYISTHSDLYPALMAGGFRASYIYNHIDASPLAIAFSDNEGENRWIQVGRNLITGWRYRVMYGGNHEGEFTIHENYLIPDSTTRHFRMLDVADDGTARYYVRNNVMKGMERESRRVTPLINDRVAATYDPLPRDTLMRPFMHPVARPHNDLKPAPSCLTIAAFPSAYMLGTPSGNDIQRHVLRQAGSGYRPEPPVADSLTVNERRTDADVISYLDRITEPERSIVVLYENDVHCRIDGYPYFVGMRDPIAADTAHVALVSCGDFLQGGLAGSMTHGQAIVDIMGNIPYDAIALGTHDFDYDNAHLEHLLQENTFPLVCANYRDVKTDTLVMAPYRMCQYGRRKVAYVGVTTPSTQITNAITFSDPNGVLYNDFDPQHVYRRVQHAVDHARAAEADYVVVLSQLGYTPDRFGVSAPGLIAATTGIDAVLDGHSHLTIAEEHIANRQNQLVLYAQGGSNFSHIGKLVIDPDGRIGSQLIATQQMKFRDPSVTQIVDSIKSRYMGSAEDYAGRSTLPIAKPKEYEPGDTQAINAGNLVTDAMRWATNTEVAWLNVGSIRQSLPAGEITRGDVLEMLPYENRLVTMQIPGSMLREVVSRLVKNLPLSGGFISPVSGLQVDLQRKKHGKRFDVTSVKVYDPSRSRYVAIDPNQIYRVVTTEYCLSIFWRSKIFTQRLNPQVQDELYSEAVFRYINEQLNGLIDRSAELDEQRVRILE